MPTGFFRNQVLKTGRFQEPSYFRVKGRSEELPVQVQARREDGSEVYDNDWKADAYVSNPFGGENSLVNIDQDLSSEKDQGPGDKED